MLARRSSAAGPLGPGKLATIAMIAVIATACGTSDDRVVVFAASSLTDVFGRLEVDFERANPGVDVVVNTGGSSSLVAQLVDGAPADVLATADPETMAAARVGASIDHEPVIFARNELVIAVERGNPLDVDELVDLSGDLVVVLASPGVPAGDYSQAILACADVEVEPASYEQNVRSVAAKVALGEADAGLVYRTDITSDLAVVEVPTACQVDAVYPIVAVSDDLLAVAFVEFVAGPDGAAALSAAGFELP